MIRLSLVLMGLLALTLGLAVPSIADGGDDDFNKHNGKKCDPRSRLCDPGPGISPVCSSKANGDCTKYSKNCGFTSYNFEDRCVRGTEDDHCELVNDTSADSWCYSWTKGTCKDNDDLDYLDKCTCVNNGDLPDKRGTRKVCSK